MKQLILALALLVITTQASFASRIYYEPFYIERGSQVSIDLSQGTNAGMQPDVPYNFYCGILGGSGLLKIFSDSIEGSVVWTTLRKNSLATQKNPISIHIGDGFELDNVIWDQDSQLNIINLKEDADIRVGCLAVVANNNP